MIYFLHNKMKQMKMNLGFSYALLPVPDGF